MCTNEKSPDVVVFASEENEGTALLLRGMYCSRPSGTYWFFARAAQARVERFTQ